MFQTIPELTGGLYNELRYNAAETLIKGPFISDVCNLLNKCGIEVQSTGVYDDILESAVKDFQNKVKMKVTGILDNNVLQALILYSNKLNDTINDDTEDEEASEDEKTTSPHYNSFFDNENYKMHRRNHKDIKIVFGNNSVTKTIKDVFMRSVTVEVDTSGNPISEIYEFIARDVKESDEINDMIKYTGDLSDGAPSDIKYNFD
jgi:hypothetical protein